jgi:GT2 family glycosyltransferase
VSDAPLVSVVVRAHDHPALHERALRSVAAQTYPHVETIVVDGAQRVTNTGMRAAKGRYVSRLDDGDVYFPEHVASLVDALERTRADVAYADAAVAYVDASGSDAGVTGYGIVDRDPVELGKMLGANQLIVPMLRTLLRKEALERVGWFSESMPIGEDYELCLRLLKESDFVHVDRITAMYTRSTDGRRPSPSNARLADAHRIIYAMHPVGERPRLLEMRNRALEELEHRGQSGARQPPWRFSKHVPLPP